MYIVWDKYTFVLYMVPYQVTKAVQLAGRIQKQAQPVKQTKQPF